MGPIGTADVKNDHPPGENVDDATDLGSVGELVADLVLFVLHHAQEYRLLLIIIQVLLFEFLQGFQGWSQILVDPRELFD